jgi:Tol biopolymer transport system component
VTKPAILLLFSCWWAFTASWGQTFEPGSVADPTQQPPSGGNGDSGSPILSPDGRYVLFASAANNLELVSSNVFPIIPPRLNVFLRDRTAGVTTLVSINLAGVGGGNGDSIPADLSTNGRYAVFESSASDLVAGDTNDATDVFVRDVLTGTTLLVSVATNGVPGNGASRSPAVTPDGRYVVFVSEANNLVENDTNGIPDIFVRDLQSGTTSLASVGAGLRNPGSPLIFSTSDAPSITPDGRYVLFLSTATNLASSVPNGCDIYVRDLVAAQTIWISSYARTALHSSSAVCFNQIMSADGRFVAYEATNTPLSGLLFYYDLQTSQTVIVHTNAAVGRTAYEDIRSVDMTPDGRFLAFVANTNGILSAQTCICLWDAQTGIFDVPSLNQSNQVPTNSICSAPTIDPSGRFVAFLSSATNMVTNSLVGQYHLYLRDRQQAATVLLNADTNGLGSLLSPAAAPRLSASGRLAAFECPDGSLFQNDRNRSSDIIVHDLDTGGNDLISARHVSLFAATPNGSSAASSAPISSDGRLLAFASDADNLVMNDTNACPDVFVRDLASGTNLLVSADTNGLPSDGSSYEPVLSLDGRYVAFTSSGDNLVANDTNHTFDVFLRDLWTGTTALVSVNIVGLSGNKSSHSPVLAGNARYVFFLSSATDLAAGSFRSENLFCRDMQSGSTFALTASGIAAFSVARDSALVAVAANSGTPAPLAVWSCASSSWVYTNGASAIGSVAMSPDGQRMVYLAGGVLQALDWLTGTNRVVGSFPFGSHPRLRFSGDGNLLAYGTTASQAAADTNTFSDVYLYDFQTESNSLISLSYSGGAANGPSDCPDISSNGRFIAYRSAATNIVPEDINGVADIFIYDRFSQITTLLSASRFGNRSASHISFAPLFSADGLTLLFESWASDLVPQDFNGTGDLFAFGLSGSSPIPIFYAKILRDASSPQSWWLTWPSSPGKVYRVQYKNSLGDDWQELNGNVTTLGNQGFLMDQGSNQTQRFYRVAASEP